MSIEPNLILVTAEYDHQTKGSRHRFIFKAPKATGVIYCHPELEPIDGLLIKLKVTQEDLAKIEYKINRRLKETIKVK